MASGSSPSLPVGPKNVRGQKDGILQIVQCQRRMPCDQLQGGDTMADSLVPSPSRAPPWRRSSVLSEISCH